MQSFTKHIMAQEIFKKGDQAPSSPEITVKPDNSKNLLVNNKSNSHK